MKTTNSIREARSASGKPKHRKNNMHEQSNKPAAVLDDVNGRNDSVILILCRNIDLNAMKGTLINFEQQFNRHHHYPYIFLNDKEWEDDFKNEIGTVTSGKAEFGKIASEDWDMPENIDRELASKNWEKMEGIPYATVESYHNMCRFYSRKFFLHPLTLKYKYYWRIEPDVKFHCPIKEDPFEVMEDNEYQYGFTIVLGEFMETIPTLWDVTKEFELKNKDRIPPDINRLTFMFDDQGKYNGLHFWSNFEVGSFEFFRSDLYRDYVEYLEKAGGFYYERWGDAPVHTLAVARFMDKKKIHFFQNICYTHNTFSNCPLNNPDCDCDPTKSINNQPNSGLSLYLKDK